MPPMAGSTASISPPSGGELGTRVREVGVERFAFVCVDPAKHRSRWMMADFLGRVLLLQERLDFTPEVFILPAFLGQIGVSLLRIPPQGRMVKPLDPLPPVLVHTAPTQTVFGLPMVFPAASQPPESSGTRC